MTLDYKLAIEPVICPWCGMHFGLPTSFKAIRRKDQKTFNCPNGHPMGYSTPPPPHAKEEVVQTAADNEEPSDHTISNGHFRNRLFGNDNGDLNGELLEMSLALAV